ncbi:MAG: phage terminase small subunit P27 family, partial [Planctomycetota bacterium]
MPARKPTALKRQAGTLQPCRTNANEPQPDPGIPPTPEHLSGRARNVSPQVAEMLFAMIVLTTADAMAV